MAGLIYLDAAYSYAFYAPGIDPVPEPPKPPMPPIVEEIFGGMQHYTKLTAPILAIYALPHDPGATADATQRAMNDALDAKADVLAKAFEAALPNAHVVRFPKANHFVFLSNEADVIREMNAFLTSLK